MTEPGIDAGAFLDHLSEAIRIRTVSYEDRDRNHAGPFHEFHAFLRNTYPLATGERCTVETVNDRSLLITWEGVEPDLDPILLMAHLDVVPVEEGTEEDWDLDPFSGAIVDGELWGRGALDDKGPLIAMMEAVEHLLRSGFQPRRTVLVALGHDEEVGGAEGAVAIAATLRDRGLRPWFVLDEGGYVVDAVPPLSGEPVALVGTAEKGYLDVKLTAVAKSGHSSVPPRSTAIGTLAAAIQRLEAHQLPTHLEVLEPQLAALEPRFDPRTRLLLGNLRWTGPLVARLLTRRPATAASIRTTTAVTMISGGVKPNTLPQEASAIVNFRVIPGDTTAAVVAHVEAVVGAGIRVEPVDEHRMEPSERSSVDSAAWAVLASSIEQTYPEAIVAPWVVSGGTDSRHFHDLAGDVYRFTGLSGTTESLTRMHGVGERMRVADAERVVSFFVRLIRNAQQTGS